MTDHESVITLLAILSWSVITGSTECEDVTDFAAVVERSFSDQNLSSQTCEAYMEEYGCNPTTGLFMAAHVAAYCTRTCGMCNRTGTVSNHPAQAAALASIYSLTKSSTYTGPVWEGADLLTDNTSNYCRWQGVACDEEGRVSVVSCMNCHLKGTLPAQIASLTDMTYVLLGRNQLSGTLTASPLTSMIGLGLYGNRFSGTITGLQQLTSMTWLGLYENSLSGSLSPNLSALTSLFYLQYFKNRLSGSISPILGGMTSLGFLALDSNRLSGQLPPHLFSSMSSLSVVVLNDNGFQGVVPTLPSALQTLAIHNNRFTEIDFLANLPALRVVTVFGNSLQGRLQLGGSPLLETLLTQNNRLSCKVVYNHSNHLLASDANYQSGAFIASGNRFDYEDRPSWAIMEGVPFVWVENDWWLRWWGFLSVAFAAALATCIAIWRSRFSWSEWRELLIFSPISPFEQIQLTCIQLLIGWSAVGMVVLVPLYAANSSAYECGVPWLRTTIAYFKTDSTLTEILLAVVTSCAAAASSHSFFVMYYKTHELYPMEHYTNAPLTWSRACGLWLCWIVLTAFYSLPSFMYGLEATMPGGSASSLGLSTATLASFKYTSGPLLAFIVSVVVPVSAHSLVTKFLGQPCPNLTTQLMCFSRTTITLLVPVSILSIFGNECLGKWLYFWRPCTSPTSFEIAATVPATLHSHAFSYQLVDHDAICNPSYVTDGKCSRFIVEGMADLIFYKTGVTAFVAPAVFLLFNLPTVVKWRERLIRRWKPEYVATASLDAEISSYVMLMELALVLGLAVPLLLPLIALAMYTNLVMFHFASTRLGIVTEHEGLPACQYLCLSVIFGSVFNVCFFWDNASSDDFRQSTLTHVLIGVPVGLLAGIVLGFLLHVSSHHRGDTCTPIREENQEENLYMELDMVIDRSHNTPRAQ